MADAELDLRVQADDAAATAGAWLAVGFIAKCRGDFTQARTSLEESVRVSREAADNVMLALSLASLAEVAYDEGNYKLARATAEEALAIARQVEFPTAIAESLLTLGNVRYQHGDYVAAQGLLEMSLAIARELGRKSSIALALASLGRGLLRAAQPWSVWFAATGESRIGARDRRQARHRACSRGACPGGGGRGRVTHGHPSGRRRSGPPRPARSTAGRKPASFPRPHPRAPLTACWVRVPERQPGQRARFCRSIG